MNDSCIKEISECVVPLQKWMANVEVSLRLWYSWPFLLVLRLYSDWPLFRQGLGTCYVVLYFVAIVANLMPIGRWLNYSAPISYHCAKLTGILFLCWFRWGCHVGWISGAFGLVLIKALVVAYVVGFVIYFRWSLLSLRVMNAVFVFFNVTVMRAVLDSRFACTYYTSASDFLHKMDTKYNSQGELCPDRREQSELCVAVEKVAVRRIFHHAWIAALMTFLCSLPQGWISWPLMIVDVIFYQRQTFLIAQEMAMLYRPAGGPNFPLFDFKTLSNLVIKIEGNFIGRQSKSVLGWIINWLVKKMPVLGCGALCCFYANFLKWFGVYQSREVVLRGIDGLVVVISGFVSAAITFWLFLPVAKRAKSYFEFGEE